MTQFCSPVTGQIEPTLTPWGGDWFDATGYAALYTATDKPCYHTGCDLNRPNYADAGAAVYAAADGEVVFRGVVAGWQGEVVVLRHTLEDGSLIWTRYAHIVTDGNTLPLAVQNGVQIGTIADYTPKGPRGDHLHFDVSHVDLGKAPGDWPGMDLARLRRDYADPVLWIQQRGE